MRRAANGLGGGRLPPRGTEVGGADRVELGGADRVELGGADGVEVEVEAGVEVELGGEASSGSPANAS